MHVALNALHLVPDETGGSELYARRLVEALATTAPELRLTVFAAAARDPVAGEGRLAGQRRAGRA